MDVIGKVIKANEETITIQIPRTAACAGCGVCQLAKGDSILEAKNLVQAQVGDLVKVSLSEKAFLKASLLAYALPLFFFVLGYLFGAVFSYFLKIRGEGLSIFFSFLFLSLSFLVLHFLFPTSSKRAFTFLPQAKEVVSPGSVSATSCDYQALNYRAYNQS